MNISGLTEIQKIHSNKCKGVHFDRKEKKISIKKILIAPWKYAQAQSPYILLTFNANYGTEMYISQLLMSHKQPLSCKMRDKIIKDYLYGRNKWNRLRKNEISTKMSTFSTVIKEKHTNISLDTNK
jgi:hypothetical protein